MDYFLKLSSVFQIRVIDQTEKVSYSRRMVTITSFMYIEPGGIVFLQN